MNDHPPIAPSAILRRYESIGGSCWELTDGSCGLSEGDPLERRLIADHHRCAWADETDRLFKSATQREAMAANNNIEKWKIWGEQTS